MNNEIEIIITETENKIDVAKFQLNNEKISSFNLPIDEISQEMIINDENDDNELDLNEFSTNVPIMSINDENSSKLIEKNDFIDGNDEIIINDTIQLLDHSSRNLILIFNLNFEFNLRLMK